MGELFFFFFCSPAGKESPVCPPQQRSPGKATLQSEISICGQFPSLCGMGLVGCECDLSRGPSQGAAHRWFPQHPGATGSPRSGTEPLTIFNENIIDRRATKEDTVEKSSSFIFFLLKKIIFRVKIGTWGVISGRWCLILRSILFSK